MKICISSESTCDLTKDQLKKYNISTVPFSVYFGDKAHLDSEITSQDIIDYVDMTGDIPKTSAVNIGQYEEYFKDLLTKYDEVIHISFSSGMSSTFNNARLAAEELGHIHVIDSLNLSCGLGLLVLYAAQLLEEGKGLDEIIKLVENRKKDVKVNFIVATTDYLHKGGRCSSLANLGAQLFRIRPQITIVDGKMSEGKKYMGKISDYSVDFVKDSLTQTPDLDLDLAFIPNCQLPKDILDSVRCVLKERGFKEIIDVDVTATVSTHCGPKGFGIAYFSTKIK